MLFQSCPNLNIHVTDPSHPHDWTVIVSLVKLELTHDHWKASYTVLITVHKFRWHWINTHTHTHHIYQAEPTDPVEGVSFSLLTGLVVVYTAAAKHCPLLSDVHYLFSARGVIKLTYMWSYLIHSQCYLFASLSFSTLSFINSTVNHLARTRGNRSFTFRL